MDETKFMNKYQELQEKFELPMLTDLQKHLNFEPKPDEEIIEQIREELSDRLFEFTEKIIEPALNGSDSLCCLFEQHMITKDERKELFELYRKLQQLKWENNILSIKPDEKRIMQWVGKTWKLWNEEAEGKMIKLCDKFSDGWGKIKFKEDQEPKYN